MSSHPYQLPMTSAAVESVAFHRLLDYKTTTGIRLHNGKEIHF